MCTGRCIFDISTTLDTALNDYWSFAQLLDEKIVNSVIQRHLQIATLTTSLYVGDECYSNIDELYNDNQTNLTLKVKAARLHSLPDHTLKEHFHQSHLPPAPNLNKISQRPPPPPAPNLKGHIYHPQPPPASNLNGRLYICFPLCLFTQVDLFAH